jgi:hypothetical protein
MVKFISPTKSKVNFRLITHFTAGIITRMLRPGIDQSSGIKQHVTLDVKNAIRQYAVMFRQGKPSFPTVAWRWWRMKQRLHRG